MDVLERILGKKIIAIIRGFFNFRSSRMQYSSIA